MLEKPLIIGHRGASAYAPENTLSAFNKAIELGCDGIELDVHLSKDGHIIVCHDESVNRTTNGKGLIGDMYLEEINKLDAGSWFSNEFKGERIPTLEEVIQLVKNKDILLNIELKNGIILYEKLEEKVINLIEQYDMINNIIISSFNHYSLMKVKDINKNIKIGLLYICGFVNPWEYAIKLGADAIHPYYYNIAKEMVTQCNNNDIMVNPYTVDKEEDLIKMIKAGVSGIITNFPDKARVILDKFYKMSG